MAVVIPAPSALSGDLSLYHTIDPLLGNSPVLIFYGPAATIGSTSSRIQIHVFTPAGYASYARLAVSPNSPFYSAVSNLPREEQGDEVCRAVAFGLKKYFSELSPHVKKTWPLDAKAPATSRLFGDEHIAILATRMKHIENVDEVIGEINQACSEQRLPWLEVDVVLPPGSIKQPANRTDSTGSPDFDDSQQLSQQYGKYAELVDSLGDLVFMPTSKLKRAPSKPTTIGRTASFLKHQKETIRKELSELLTTEENYVARMSELQIIATSLGQGNAATADKLRDVFPPGIGDIVELNGAFLDELRATITSTEQGALHDIESTSEIHTTAQQARQDFVADNQGISAVAKCLVSWLPKLASAYSAYLEAQAQSAASLHDLLKDGDSAAVTSLQEVGEQKLTSLLIEPVQRLPRYNLYIDSMMKQLPVRHPAIKPLLKARDTVSEICEHGADAAGATAWLAKLENRVSGWPRGLQEIGRLVTIVDFVEVVPPYTSEGCTAGRGMLLLFTDSVIVLGKQDAATSAKAFLTELESGRPALRHLRSGLEAPQDLEFLRKIDLDSLEMLETHDGRIIHMMTRFTLEGTANPPLAATVDSSQMLRLEGAYEGKAERLIEETAKARIEGRFGEPERESHKWEVRASDPAPDAASIFSTIFEDSNAEHLAARASPATIRLIIDIDRHSQRPRSSESAIRTVVSASPLRDGMWRLSFDSVDGTISQEHVALSDVSLVLRRRLSYLASTRFALDQPPMTSAMLARNTGILESFNLRAIDAATSEPNELRQHERASRPKSPKKFLSSFLSSTGPGTQPPGFLKKDLPPLPPPSRMPSVQSNSSAMKPPSRESRPPSRDQPTPMSMASMRSTEHLLSPIKRLEDTLSTYMLALQARKGNIVGRNLKMRATADELAVNELYNSLLEDPNMMVLAAQTSVDVLFVAFEKFLNVAWREQIGQILPSDVLQDIQAKAESLFPIEFDQYFKTTVAQLPPQNQRAFKGIVKLLADLLDGTGNDGDRGILTAAFADVLVTDGNPHDYIALIDRFVDDPDTYFGEPLDELQRANESAYNPHKRARSVNSASITSNTSSLRKKFGFGTLSRENSKSEQESKVSSVWRTLSKSTRGDASPANSISKGSLHRSYSTDTDGRPGMPQRPASQDGSSRPGLTSEDSYFSGMSSALNLGLSTIGEHPSFIPTQPPRKKRRSSLSDLKALEHAQQKSPTAAWTPSPRRPPVAQRYLDEKSLPNSPMPSTPSSKGGSGRYGSPTKEPPRSRLPSSFRKENSPGPAKAFTTSPEQRPKTSPGKPDEVVITARPTSNIPTLTPKPLTLHKTNISPSRSGLAERPGAGNIVKKPSPQPEKASRPMPTTSTTDAGSPKKLRMQSPQKLRERLQNEKAAVAAAHTSLQDELSKIGDELTSTPSRIGSVRTPGTYGRPKSTTSAIQQTSNMELAQRVLKLEGQLPSTIDTLNARISTIQSDLATSLSVSESKCKKLDELYREANGENEALYARFNEELGRVLRAVKSGEGVEECRKKLAESQEEVASLRREVGRLRRENVGLRAQMRE